MFQSGLGPGRGFFEDRTGLFVKHAAFLSTETGPTRKMRKRKDQRSQNISAGATEFYHSNLKDTYLMIKTVMCIRRKPGLSREEFEHHWKNIHAPLIRELKQDLRILRYVQSNANEDRVSGALRSQRNGPEKFDGIGQAWFASLADLIEAGRDPASARALETLRQDEMRFIDLENSPMFVVEEDTVFDDLPVSGG